MNEDKIAEELLRVAKELLGGGLEVGDWFSQEYNGIYGIVIEIQKNGSPKVVTYSDDHRRPKKESTKGWHPVPKKIDKGWIPADIRKKIEKAAGPIKTARELTAKEDRHDIVKRILSESQAAKIDGVTIDLVTANLLNTVFNAIKPVTKAKLDKIPIKALVDVAWSLT